MLDGLLQKGLFTETIIGKRRYFVAEDPEPLLKEKQSQLQQIVHAIPELRILMATASVRPKISVYEGIEGLRKLYMETLHAKSGIVEFVSLENIHPDIEFHSSRYYIPQRINRRIPIKIIVSGATVSKKIRLRTDKYALREVKTIDQVLYPIPLDVYIYNNNVSFALYRTDSEPVGIIIRSQEIATALRSLHALIWTMI